MIINNELPSSRVYESNTVAALMDIDPVTAGHVLVMPKAPDQGWEPTSSGPPLRLRNVADEVLPEWA